MSNEASKDFNAMLHQSRDLPRMQVVTDAKTIEKYGGRKMYVASPLDYDRVMKQVPFGKVCTVPAIRAWLARQSGADFTEPMTAGIFISMAAWASHQRTTNPTPYWRTLKADGELNDKYPGGAAAQKERLEAEGHTILQKGRKRVRYFVRDYASVLFAPGSPSGQTGDTATHKLDDPAIQSAVLRIRRMEQLFDAVTAAVQHTPEQLQTQAMQDAVRTLTDYVESGEWLRDYDLDERRLLPPTLKRGVLSQDGLYDLLCTLREDRPKQERRDFR